MANVEQVAVAFRWFGTDGFLCTSTHRAKVVHMAGGMTCPADVWSKLDGSPATPLGGGLYDVLGMTVRVQPYLRPPYGCSEQWDAMA